MIIQIVFYEKRPIIDVQIELWTIRHTIESSVPIGNAINEFQRGNADYRATEAGQELDKNWRRIRRRAAAPGRLAAPLLPWPGHVALLPHIHTHTHKAAIRRMNSQTQIVIFWKKGFEGRDSHRSPGVSGKSQAVFFWVLWKIGGS